MFVYDGWQNAAVLFMLAIAYLPFSSHQVPKERQSRSKFIATAVFPVAIVANGFWTALKPLSVTYAQSGVVYAAWGALMAFCVIDAYPRGTVKGAWIPRYSSKEEKSAAVANLAIVVLTVGTIILNPRIFLGESQGVNGFVHTVAFLGGYLSAYAWHRQARTFARGPTSPRLNMVGKRSIVLRR